MAGPCLPFCHWPTFPGACESIAGDMVCCIEFTVPCGGNLHYDGYLIQLSDEYYYDTSDGLYDLEGVSTDQTCHTNADGLTPIAVGYNDPEVEGDVIQLFYPGATMPQVGLLDLNCEFMGYPTTCPNWPDRLTEISGGLIEHEVVSESPFHEYYRKALPHIRWSCHDGGAILFEVGWVVITVHYYLVGAYSEYTGFYPISTGNVQPDWYLGDAFTLDSVESGENTYNSVVTPVLCNYEPCGESLDCFPDCISGTLDCDGETPAHAPLTLTISAAESCCLTGTFTLTYVDDRYSIPEDAQPSCEVDSDCIGPVVLTMGAELYCASAPSLETPLEEWTQDDGGLAMLHIWMTDGCGDRQDFYALVILVCDGGLTPATGTFEIDTMCGDNTTNEFDWTLSA